jgi:hypothetical protein
MCHRRFRDMMEHSGAIKSPHYCLHSQAKKNHPVTEFTTALMTNVHCENLVPLLTCQDETVKLSFLCAVANRNPGFVRSGFHTRMVTIFECHSFFC